MVVVFGDFVDTNDVVVVVLVDTDAVVVVVVLVDIVVSLVIVSVAGDIQQEAVAVPRFTTFHYAAKKVPIGWSDILQTKCRTTSSMQRPAPFLLW